MHNIFCILFFLAWDAILLLMPSFFWSTSIDNWTSNEQRWRCLSLLCSGNDTLGRIYPQVNLLWNTLQIYKMYHLELLLSVCWVILIKTICFQERFELRWISKNRRVVLSYLSQLSIWCHLFIACEVSWTNEWAWLNDYVLGYLRTQDVILCNLNS